MPSRTLSSHDVYSRCIEFYVLRSACSFPLPGNNITKFFHISQIYVLLGN